MGERSGGLESVVERTGLEPVTSALSKQRSEPTELTFRIHDPASVNFKCTILMIKKAAPGSEAIRGDMTGKE
jgi:hypothetical protein